MMKLQQSEAALRRFEGPLLLACRAEPQARVSFSLGDLVVASTPDHILRYGSASGPVGVVVVVVVVLVVVVHESRRKEAWSGR